MSAASRSHSPFARLRVNGANVEPGALLGAAAMAMMATLAGAACGCSSTTPKAEAGTDAGTGTGGKTTTTDGGSGGKGVAGSTGTKDGGVGTGGAGGAGGSASPASFLGLSCATAHDCGPVLDCLKPGGNDILGAAGPAGGYCSFKCASATDANCTAANGICENLNTTADPQYYCFQSCTLGTDPTTTDKCHQRTDVACQPTTATAGDTSGVCFPACSSDVECPSNRHCLINLCVDASVTLPGLTLYNHCDPNAVAPATSASPVPAGLCQESCLSFSMTTLSFCTTTCVLGSPTACNYALMSSPLAPTATANHGVCSPFASTDQLGDSGYCTQQCDKAADCRDQTDTGLVCDTTVVGLDHGFCNWM